MPRIFDLEDDPGSDARRSILQGALPDVDGLDQGDSWRPSDEYEDTREPRPGEDDWREAGPDDYEPDEEI